MAHCDFAGFYNTYIRYSHWAIGGCIQDKLDSYEFDVLSHWRFPRYCTCRQSGCPPLVSYPLERPITELHYAVLMDRANRAQFADVYLRHIDEDEDVPEIDVPTVQGITDNIGKRPQLLLGLSHTLTSYPELEELEQIGAPDTTDVFTTPEQLSEGLLTLSLLPRSRWQTLLNLDTIRVRPWSSLSLMIDKTDEIQQRNKPKEAPKAPERAPFFLPTVSGLETRFDLSTAEVDGEASSKRLAPMSSFMESDFTRRMGNERPDGDCMCYLLIPGEIPDRPVGMLEWS